MPLLRARVKTVAPRVALLGPLTVGPRETYDHVTVLPREAMSPYPRRRGASHAGDSRLYFQPSRRGELGQAIQA